MDKNRKVRSIGCLVLLVFFLMPTLALGSDTTIDTQKDVSLIIHYQDEEKPLTDASFQLYLVATLDEQGNRTVTNSFQKYPVDFEANDQKVWKSMADTLEGFIAIDNYQKPIANGKTNQDGTLLFGANENLKPGLYLVTGKRHGQDERVYYAKPFLVQLPAKEYNGSWQYAVTAKTKHESVAAPGGKNSGEPYWISRKVLKVWDDKGQEAERPQNITVQLLRDGEVYDSVALTDDGNWRYEWPALSKNHRWTVVEKDSGNYDVCVSQEGITFVVTNTPKEKNPDEENPNGDNPLIEEFPENPTPTGSAEPPDEGYMNWIDPLRGKLPQTGQLWWPVAVLLVSGMVFIIAGLFLRRGENYGAE